MTDTVGPPPGSLSRCACEQHATPVTLQRLAHLTALVDARLANLAQVRCSGKKSGCARCVEYGKHCEYLMSMVGRRSSKRSKHATAQAALETEPGSKDGPGPSPASTANQGAVTPLSEDTPVSRASTIPPWPFGSTTASSNGIVTPVSEKSTTSFTPTTPSWSGQLIPASADDLLEQIELDNASNFLNMTSDNPLSERNHGGLINNGQVPQSGQDLLDPDLNFDQYGIPDIRDSIQDLSQSNALLLGQSGLSDYSPTGIRISGPSQAGNPAELLEVFEVSDLRDEFPYISALGTIIGLLEGHLQNKATAIDEVMRVNKECMTKIVVIMNSEVFKRCKSCRMLILTALDLVITLYEKGVSEDVRSAPQSSRPQLIDHTGAEKATLQFGVFQFDPEDLAMFRNQIVRNELERCIQMIQGQCTEFGSRLSVASTPSHKVYQQWVSVIENRARILASSLK